MGHAEADLGPEGRDDLQDEHLRALDRAQLSLLS
jgi:hypothetical protein